MTLRLAQLALATLGVLLLVLAPMPALSSVADGNSLGDMAAGCGALPWAGGVDPCDDGAFGNTSTFAYVDCDNFNVVTLDLSGQMLTGCQFPSTWSKLCGEHLGEGQGRSHL